MSSKLILEVSWRKENVTGVKPFLVLAMAAFHLAIMSRSVGADAFMADAQFGSGFLEKGWNVPAAVGKTVCKLKSVIGLDTLHADASAGIPLYQTL